MRPIMPIACLFLSLSLPLFAEETPMNTEYYTGFYSNYRLPFKVKDEEKITAEKAHQQRSYIVVQRDVRGNIVDFKKYVDGELFIHHRYQYDDNGQWQGYEDMLKTP
ncbi:MAG: DUF6156 family protein [Cardiobacteriaceae bacterium]|nr:DUF6156 family protein [Cardiobacteriaceae bacterium]